MVNTSGVADLHTNPLLYISKTHPASAWLPRQADFLGGWGRNVFRDGHQSVVILKSTLLRRLYPDRDGRTCTRRECGAERLLSADDPLGYGRDLCCARFCGVSTRTSRTGGAPSVSGRGARPSWRRAAGERSEASRLCPDKL